MRRWGLFSIWRNGRLCWETLYLTLLLKLWFPPKPRRKPATISSPALSLICIVPILTNYVKAIVITYKDHVLQGWQFLTFKFIVSAIFLWSPSVRPFLGRAFGRSHFHAPIQDFCCCCVVLLSWLPFEHYGLWFLPGWVIVCIRVNVDIGVCLCSWYWCVFVFMILLCVCVHDIDVFVLMLVCVFCFGDCVFVFVFSVYDNVYCFVFVPWCDCVCVCDCGGCVSIGVGVGPLCDLQSWQSYTLLLLLFLSDPFQMQCISIGIFFKRISQLSPPHPSPLCITIPLLSIGQRHLPCFVH